MTIASRFAGRGEVFGLDLAIGTSRCMAILGLAESACPAMP